MIELHYVEWIGYAAISARLVFSISNSLLHTLSLNFPRSISSLNVSVFIRQVVFPVIAALIFWICVYHAAMLRYAACLLSSVGQSARLKSERFPPFDSGRGHGPHPAVFARKGHI